MKKEIIILAPDFDTVGGVSSYVNSLKGQWPVKENYILRGARINEKYKLVRIIKDYIKIFVYLLINQREKRKYILLVNTSMNMKAMQRDYFNLLLFKIFGFDYSVFIHGWDPVYYESNNDKYKAVLSSASNIFVLSVNFKNQLRKYNVNNNIYVETTLVNNEFIKYIDNYNTKVEYQDEDHINILFLSRLEPEKGINILINAFKTLNSKQQFKNKVTLTIAGTGSLDNDIINSTKEVENIKYVGYVSGRNKYELIAISDIHILPTMHNEGMPISIIEALVAGNYVISSKVGSLPSIINESNGLLLDHISENEIVNVLENAMTILKNNQFNKLSSMKDAVNKYSAQSVSNRLSHILGLN